MTSDFGTLGGQCMVCFDRLEIDQANDGLLKTENVNPKESGGSETTIDDSDAYHLFHIFTTSFELEIPKSIYNAVAASDLRFCEKCKRSVLQMGSLLSQIRLLQEEMRRTKRKIKSEICKSRQVFQEKENNCVNVNVSMIRDLSTGVRVALVPLKRPSKPVHSFLVETKTPAESVSCKKVKAKIWNPPIFVFPTQNIVVPTVSQESKKSVDLADTLKSVDESSTAVIEDDFNQFNDDNSSSDLDTDPLIIISSSTTRPKRFERCLRSHDNDPMERDFSDGDDNDERILNSGPSIRKTVQGANYTTNSLRNPKKRKRTHEKSKMISDKRTKSSKEPKLKVTTTQEGRLFYQDVEILKVENGFRCVICQGKKFFKYQVSAVLHIKKNHVKDKDGWFQCETCGKQFLHKSLLYIHQECHIQEKPLMCDICGRLFKLKSTLIGHRKTHGDGPKPFCCEFCGKQFARVRDCVVHTRTHTKERPFKCDICPKSFIVRTLLNAHRKTHAHDRIPSFETNNSNNNISPEFVIT